MQCLFDLFRDVSHETIGFETTLEILIIHFFLRFLTPRREPGDKEWLICSNKIFLLRFLTPRREPGDKEWFIFSKTNNFFRFLTPRREPGDKEGLLILLCLTYVGSIVVDMGSGFVKIDRISIIYLLEPILD